MDPLTAAFTALNSFNQFLLTPVGQKIANDFEAVVAGLLSDLHVHLASNLPTAATNPTANPITNPKG